MLIHNNPMFIPCSTMERDILFLTFPTCWIQIKNLVPFMYPMWKGLFHLQDINLENRPHNWHGNHLAQSNSLLTLHFGEILYFLKISFVLIFVWLCTIGIVLPNDTLSSSTWVAWVENCQKIKIKISDWKLKESSRRNPTSLSQCRKKFSGFF